MLRTLLERNDEHLCRLADDCFEGLHEAQSPKVVSVCCSDSRVPQQGMWCDDGAGWHFTSSNIGNQVWDVVDGEKVVDGSLLYPIAHTDTHTVVVVGHTGCGAVTAAYEWVVNDAAPENDGVRALVESLVPVVEKGLQDPSVDETADRADVINQLVEFSVREQVEFLVESDEIPDDVTVYGFVYDFQGVYGDAEGCTYVVSVDGETGADIDAPEGYEDRVRSLLG